jgi:hypothetical protein
MDPVLAVFCLATLVATWIWRVLPLEGVSAPNL